MSLDALLARLESRGVTPVTAAVTPDVTWRPAPMLACTAVTPVTAGNDVVASDAVNKPFDGERFEERAAIMEFDGGLTRQEAERLALPESPVSGSFGTFREDLNYLAVPLWRTT